MNFKPFGKRVVVQRIENENKTTSGLLLPNNIKKEKEAKGVVVSVSDEISSSNLINLNDVVYFKEFKAHEIKLNENEYLVLEIEDILGKLV